MAKKKRSKKNTWRRDRGHAWGRIMYDMHVGQREERRMYNKNGVDGPNKVHLGLTPGLTRQKGLNHERGQRLTSTKGDGDTRG